jgi:hypothetical protein
MAHIKACAPALVYVACGICCTLTLSGRIIVDVEFFHHFSIFEYRKVDPFNQKDWENISMHEETIQLQKADKDVKKSLNAKDVRVHQAKGEPTRPSLTPYQQMLCQARVRRRQKLWQITCTVHFTR